MNGSVSKNETIDLFNFYKKYGILIEYESLVSCQSGEAIMLSDHIKSIGYLNYVYLHLPELEVESFSGKVIFSFLIEFSIFNIE